MSAKKTNTKVAVKVIKRTRKANPLHQKLERLFTQKGGCTMHDTFNIGYKYPAIQALKMMDRRGYKVSVKKVPGKLTVYSATKRGA